VYKSLLLILVFLKSGMNNENENVLLYEVDQGIESSSVARLQRKNARMLGKFRQVVVGQLTRAIVRSKRCVSSE
jgi:hypothetical protein